VVDDNADIRAYVRSVLEPAYRVLEAADGQEGLERARAALPDLVIADLMMPRLDGFGLARALREDPATDCIPVILLTARVEPGHEVEGLGTGADDFITKPFHAGVLEARVGNLIASRRRLRERFRQEGLPAPAAQSLPAPQRSDLEARLRALVEANLSDPDFNPEALATAAGLSYQRLHRRISRELEVTPSHFIRTVRVERAALLLREGAGSVTEVAYSVGFNSLSYFHRCFQERFGTAPSATTKLPA
jgi:DNA-binding response OmpR family regulator